MNRKPGVYASVIVVLIMFAVAAWAWPQIPAGAQIPVHWSINGAPNGYAGKVWGLIGIPLLVAGLAVLLAGIPSIEPRAMNLARSGRAYTAVWIAVVVVVAAEYCASVLNAVGRSVDIGLITPIAVGSLFMVVGNYLGKVRSNFFFGVRTPWTLSSEQSWSKTHRLARPLTAPPPSGHGPSDVRIPRAATPAPADGRARLARRAARGAARTKMEH